MISKIEERRISQRLKQINIAKNSIGYQRYTTAVKKNERKRELNFTWHPSTPDPYSNTSKSCFSGRLKEWKLRLHLWGNLDDLSYDYIIENNLKIPSEENFNCNNKINYIKSILDNSNIHTKDSSFKFIKFSDLRISPISFSEENSFKKTIRASKHQLTRASNSQINSISLSEKLLLPKIIDCKKSYEIENYVTLFIPDNYKGVLVWKSSNFIRHCDITLAANRYYCKTMKYGLCLSKFNRRHDINILEAFKHPDDSYLKDINIEIFEFREKCNGFCKLKNVPSKYIYSLVNSQKIINHRSNKVILTRNKLFGFREKEIFRLSFSYHPCTIIYCKVLEKLGKVNVNTTHPVIL